VPATNPQEIIMSLLVVALLLLLLFGGLGFVAHVLWLGIVLAVAFAVAHMLVGGGTRV
jgi:hypothetical protein